MSARLSLILLLFVACAGPDFAQTSASLRALMALSSGNIVWASGTGGTVLRSTDGGKSWPACSPAPDAEKLDFRGLYAWDEKNAVVMSSGPGPLSRLYRTADGCNSWRLLLTNPDPDGFWDSVTFNANKPNLGTLLGDPVKGRFTLFRTTDAGQHWIRDANPGLASSPAGEGAFAASNSSLVFLPGTRDLLFGTGGPGGFRILRFEASANRWTASSLPSSFRNESSGVFSIACRDALVCLAAGGDYKHAEGRASTTFVTKDGGRTWSATATFPGGYRSSAAWKQEAHAWVVAGPGGVDVSFDDGRSWRPLPGESNWNVLSLPWAAGSKGHFARLAIPAQ